MLLKLLLLLLLLLFRETMALVCIDRCCLSPSMQSASLEGSKDE
jgi:hypothetical protein